jgi:exosome complex component RRP42
MSSSSVLSPGERRFVLAGVRQDVRADGRRRLERRGLRVQCGLLPQANGSARVALAGGGTEVLAAVRCELADPDPRAPGRGRVECAVEVWASARASLAGGGGGGGGGSADAAAAANAELSAAVARQVCARGAVDLERLCVLRGRQAWSVFVDLVVLEAGGGALLDACCLAAHAALRDARLPRLRLVPGEAAGEFDVELDDNPLASDPFPAGDLPVSVAFTLVGGLNVVDADAAEEACASARTVVAVNRRGRICALECSGAGGTAPGALHAAAEAAKALAEDLFARVDRAVAERAARAARAEAGGEDEDGEEEGDGGGWSGSFLGALGGGGDAVVLGGAR